MKVAILGSGGREDAIAWRLREEQHDVIVVPGSDVIEGSFAADLAQHEALAIILESRGVDLVVVGPEVLLAAGIADSLRKAGFAVLGPSAESARLETSKAYAKAFMTKHGVRTPFAEVAKDAAAAIALVAMIDGPIVIKLDGMALGKGVVVCADRSEAEEAVASLAMRFGEHQAFLVERHLVGRELSLVVLTDGKHVQRLPVSQDHKRLFDGDKGPNTGGMGALCPVPWADEKVLAEIDALIVAPTLRGLAEDHVDYRGVLYFGVMVTADGPYLLEYNARFGDPETQAVVPMIAGDFGSAMLATARGATSSGALDTKPGFAVAVVLAAKGYPDTPTLGDAVTGLDGTDKLVFRGGLKRTDGKVVTAGGRVCSVVGRGATIEAARADAYAAVKTIAFPNAQLRRDIGNTN